MIVLAIHDGHDAGCALLRDGELALYSAEERRRNVKNSSGVPEASIRAVLERSGTAPGEVDLIALCGRIRTTPVTREVRTVHRMMRVGYRLARSRAATRAAQWVLARTSQRAELHAFLAALGLGGTPVEAFDHHECHAATAYYHRPFDGDALVLTHDGAGDGLCATVSVGRGPELARIAWTTKFHSPANFLYSALTAHLGLKPWEHEYKVMGMAPYGRAEHCADALRELFAVEGLEFRNRAGVIGPALERLYAERLQGQRFDNVAAACQLVFEELVLEWVRNALQATGLRKVVAAGGAFLNVKANKLVRELAGVDAFYAYPASDDGGQPIGGAILGYLSLCRARGVAPRLRLPRHMYLGLEHTEDEMARAAAASGLPWRRMADPAGAIADLLASGRIVARFAGREEVGPRALGNRSILADPRDLKTVRRLNFAIKHRDFWMPFAASVLEEDAPEYIAGLSSWPFWMIEAFDTTPAGAMALLAGIHPFDETIRPQIVNDLNPDYRDLIRAFRRRTGVGGLLNTSFNLHGSPIVGSPAVAVETLLKSGLDALALGPFLIEKTVTA
jgi:carbamoyltransferase